MKIVRALIFGTVAACVPEVVGPTLRRVCHVETVCFRVPASWETRTEKNGDGVYWDPQEGTATLHVSLITGVRKNGSPPVEATEQLLQLTHWVQSDAPAVLLANGHALREVLDPEGPPDTFRFYLLHNAHSLVHVAHFSLNLRRGPGAESLHSLIREEIKAASFEPATR